MAEANTARSCDNNLYNVAQLLSTSLAKHQTVR